MKKPKIIFFQGIIKYFNGDILVDSFLADINGSAAVAIFYHLNVNNIFWQYFGNFIGPFNKTVISGIKIIFVSEIKHLFNFFYSVKIKVINNISIAGLVFIN